MHTTFSLSAHVAKCANSVFLRSGQQNISFEDFIGQVTAVAQKLKLEGLREKDVVALAGILPQNIPVIFFAIWLNKAIALPLNPKFPERQIETILKENNTIFYISDNSSPPFFGFDVQVPLLRGVRCGPVFSHLPGDLLAKKKQTSYELCTKDLLSQTYETSSSNFDLDLQNIATIILTSGSSATPKYAAHSLGNHFSSARAVNKYFKISDTDNWLLALPVFHVAGLAVMIRAFVAGATLSIPAPDENLSDALQKYRPTHISLVTTQLQRLLESDHNIKVLQECKAVFLGGSAIPKSLIEKSLNLNLNLFTSYGMTELCSTIAIKRITDRQTGKAEVLPIHQIKIADYKEIFIKSESLCRGYFRAGKIENILGPAGWFHTKDLGRLNNTNQLTVLGRKDNMFISGGENIYPEEIEKHLLVIADLEQAIVVPRPDSEFGFRPVAFIHPYKEGIPQLLSDHLKKILPTYKIPVSYYPIPKEKLNGIKINRANLEKHIP